MTPMQSANSTSGRAAAGKPVAPKLASHLSVRAIDAYGVIGLIAVGMAAFFLGFRPLVQRHQIATDEREQISTTREKLSQQQSALANSRSQQALLRQQYQGAGIALESARNLNDRLASLSEVAGSNAVILDDLQPDKSASGPQFDSLPIRLTGGGPMPACAGLLHQLHRDWPDVGVVSFDLSGNPRDQADVPKLNVQLVWYTQPTQKKIRLAGAADQATEPGKNNRSLP